MRLTWLTRPSLYATTTAGSHPVRTAAGLGLLAGALARVWMRSISEEPVFSVVGTLLILAVFAGMGAVAGWVYAWRTLGLPKRPRLTRTAAFVPFVLMGPFMLLFLPSLGLALVTAKHQWRRIFRWPIITLAVLAALFFELVFLQAPLPLLAATLYLVLSWAMFIALRLGLEPVTQARGEA